MTVIRATLKDQPGKEVIIVGYANGIDGRPKAICINSKNLETFDLTQLDNVTEKDCTSDSKPAIKSTRK